MIKSTIRIPIIKFVGVLFFLVITWAPCSFAQAKVGNTPVTGTITPTAFDQRFVNFMRRWRVPGASVAVMKNNQLIFSRGYGWADVDARQPVTADSVFRVGSVSKAITSVTVLKLAQEGKLHLDDNVFDILSDLKPLNNHKINPQIYQITVRNLLQMSSGWKTNVIDPMFGPWSIRMLNQLNSLNDAGVLPPSCETAARMMMSMPLQSKPGTTYSYSNINYCLLGLIVNKTSGMPYGYQNYEGYVQQHILAPLGISNMRIGDTWLPNRAPNEVRYYSYLSLTNPNDLMARMIQIDGLPYSGSQILKKNFADGGWVASSIDLVKFLQAVNNHQIISPQMKQVMLARPTYHLPKKTEGYFAMGWSVKYVNGRLYWMKTGSFTGTYAVIIQRDDGTSYAAVFNTKPSQRPVFVSQLRQLLSTI